MGLGYCPDSEPLGKEMVGKDGMMWVVRAPKGIKMWARVTAEEKKLVREPPVLINTDDDKSDDKNELEDPFGWKPVEEDNNDDDTIKEEEVKPPTPKKRGRPAKAKEINDKPVEDDIKPEPKKRGRPPKAKKNDEEEPKKERKPRAKTEYNEFLSAKMKELREKHKDDTEKLKTTEYLKMAIAEWKVYKAAKVNA